MGMGDLDSSPSLAEEKWSSEDSVGSLSALLTSGRLEEKYTVLNDAGVETGRMGI